MNDYPVILSYFAQSPDQEHLAMLVDEESSIKRFWEEATNNEQNPVNVLFLSRDGREATIQKAREDIQKYRDRIVMFHFSGHADNDQLLLNDGAGGSEGIAGLLGEYAKNLKIVVLNGCSTEKQVNTFFGQNTPVVVATQCAVKDAHAQLFATTFHQKLAEGNPIETAYRVAITTVRTESKLGRLLPGGVDLTPTVVRGGMLDTTRQAGKIWGLFVQENREAIVNDQGWLLIRHSTESKKKIHPEKAYICDRNGATYSDTFYNYFDPLKPDYCRIQQYLLAGEPTQSPIGLVRKFFFEKILQSIDRERFDWKDYYYAFVNSHDNDRGIEVNKTDKTELYILHKLLSSVNGTRSVSKTISELCTEFFAHIRFKNCKYVLIAFRISSDALTTETIKAIQNTIRLLNETGCALTNPTTFLFFWVIEHKRSPFDIFSFGSPLKKLISHFDDFLRDSPPAGTPRLWLINEDYKFLQIPDSDDIVNWKTDQFGKAISDDLLKRLIEQKNVKELETELLELIKTANLQPT